MLKEFDLENHFIKFQIYMKTVSIFDLALSVTFTFTEHFLKDEFSH